MHADAGVMLGQSGSDSSGWLFVVCGLSKPLGPGLSDDSSGSEFLVCSHLVNSVPQEFG